jgi:hypothetical protein
MSPSSAHTLARDGAPGPLPALLPHEREIAPSPCYTPEKSTQVVHMFRGLVEACRCLKDDHLRAQCVPNLVGLCPCREDLLCRSEGSVPVKIALRKLNPGLSVRGAARSCVINCQAFIVNSNSGGARARQASAVARFGGL